MNSEFTKFFNDTYALGKLEEFAFELFVSIKPARVTLSENLQYIAIISPEDFRLKKHQEKWRELQKKFLGKTKNIGLRRHPIERITVRNKTLSWALKAIWDVYEETSKSTH